MIDKCPRCGGKTGYYTKERQTLYSFFRFGETEPYDSEQSARGYGGEVMYCIDCDNRIGRTSEVER